MRRAKHNDFGFPMWFKVTFAAVALAAAGGLGALIFVAAHFLGKYW